VYPIKSLLSIGPYYFYKKNKIQIMTSKTTLNLQKNGFTRSFTKISARISFPEVNEKSDLFYRKFFWVCNPKERHVDEVMTIGLILLLKVILQ
jgi:hypothetical protein